jgi:hypothetical protein
MGSMFKIIALKSLYFVRLFQLSKTFLPYAPQCRGQIFILGGVDDVLFIGGVQEGPDQVQAIMLN